LHVYSILTCAKFNLCWTIQNVTTVSSRELCMRPKHSGHRERKNHEGLTLLCLQGPKYPRWITQSNHWRWVHYTVSRSVHQITQWCSIISQKNVILSSVALKISELTVSHCMVSSILVCYECLQMKRLISVVWQIWFCKVLFQIIQLWSRSLDMLKQKRITIQKLLSNESSLV